MTEWPMTLGWRVCANGETIEWYLRVGDETVASFFESPDPERQVGYTRGTALARLLKGVES